MINYLHQLTTRTQRTQRNKKRARGQGEVTDTVTHEKRLEFVIKSRVAFKIALLSESDIEESP